MVYANNPQAVINGFYSSSRNVFLTVSVAIAMYGFSNTFKLGISQSNIKIISLLILVFSFMLGINNLYIFNRYINNLKKDKENLPIYVDLPALKAHIYIKLWFVLLVAGVLIFGVIRLKNRLY